MKSLFYLVPLLLMINCTAITSEQTDYTQYVNTLIGTQPWSGKIQLAGPELAEGHTYPGVCPPFAMTQWTPQTTTGDIPYWYEEGDDAVIQGFRSTHYPSGAVMADYASFTLMPMNGKLKLQPEERQSYFDHDTETAKPHYYSVFLADYQIKSEITATSRCGFFQFTFPKSNNAYLLLDFFKESGHFEINDRKTEITGYALNKGHGAPENFKGYFVIQFDKPFDAFDKQDDPGKTETDKSAWVEFQTEKNKLIKIRIGTSFISIDQARQNLEKEIPHWQFDRIKHQTQRQWNQELSKIQVETNSQKDKTIFYTAMYHSLILPREMSEYGRYYSPYDGKIHKGIAYTDYSLWDTFRSEHPLLLLLVPDRVNEMITSLLNSYDEGGWIPKWPNPGYSNVMMGSHADAVIADAFIKGVRNYDVSKAYEAMVKNSTQKGTGKYAGRVGILDYNRLGYVPGDRHGECVARTLEFAYDDFCIAQLAKAMGKNDDYESFIAKSKNYQNVLDPETGLVRGKNSDGKWQNPNNKFISVWAGDSEQSLNIYKWNHTFLVPHDVSGLIDFLGDKKQLVKKLDTLFHSEYYYVGDEFSMHAPYLYNYAGTPWKTQALTRNILENYFDDGPDGLCGNEDCGQMSAWYIFGAMGFFPVCPGDDSYALTTPIFDKITLQLPKGKTFKIIAKNNSSNYKYIQSVHFNGQPIRQSSITHEDIMAGGELVFVLDDQPNRNWSSSEPNIPKLSVKKIKRLQVPYMEQGEKTFTQSTSIKLASYVDSVDIYYSLDGSEPTHNGLIYSKPFSINETKQLKFRSVKAGYDPSPVVIVDFLKIPSGRSIQLNTQYSDRYTAGGKLGLIDGKTGGEYFNADKWQGYEVNNCEAIITLDQEETIRTVTIGCLQDINNWIFFPPEILVYTSKNGKDFKLVEKLLYSLDKPQSAEVDRKEFSAKINKTAKYIKIIVENIGHCPDWHDFSGGKAWIFIDEIQVKE